MEHHDIPHNTENFRTSIAPLVVIYDAVFDQEQEGLPSLPPVKSQLTIRYKKMQTYRRRAAQGGITNILKQTEEQEITMSNLLLQDLKCPHSSSMILSSELSNLGVESRHHKDVIARIVRCADGAAAEIEEEKNRTAVLVSINMHVRWFIVKWINRVDNYNCIENTSCAICLEEFGVGNLGVRLPCLHAFHEECAHKWLLKTLSCPLCRFDMSINFDF